MKEKAKKRLLSILEMVPSLKKIIVSDDSLEKKRKKIRNLLNAMLINTYDDNPDLPSLAWLLSRYAILVFRNITSRRSEKVAGFSLLGYLNDLIHKGKVFSGASPSQDFFAELKHLIHGISGHADVYPKSKPAFSLYKGKRAAKLRSADLSRMARIVEKFWVSFIAASSPASWRQLTIPLMARKISTTGCDPTAPPIQRT